MRKLLSLSIPIVLGVGMLAALVYSPEPDKDPAALGQKGGVTDVTGTDAPAVIEKPATTSTTAAPTTTTTAAPVTTTTTTTARRVSAPAPRPAPRRQPAPQQAPQPAPQPAPAPVQSQAPAPRTVDCGTGGASTLAELVTGNQFVVTVKNGSNKAVELDTLSLKATYASGVKSFNLSVAGRRIAPGAEVTFEATGEPNETPKSFEISQFKFHTAGVPECQSVRAG